MKYIWIAALALFAGCAGQKAHYEIDASLKVCETGDDKIIGCVKRDYRADGSLRRESTYNEGVMEGVAKAYYPNGAVAMEGEVCLENPCGVWFFYDKRGEMSLRVEMGENNEVLSAKCHNGASIAESSVWEIAEQIEIEMLDTNLTKACGK